MHGSRERRADRWRRAAEVAALLLCATALTRATSARAASTATPWSIYASSYTYVLRHDRDYVNVNVGLDRDHVHVEARLDYEDLDTGSLWVGYNIDGGSSDLVYQLTPMIGGVFGHLNGVAPGYELTLALKGVALSGQGEYVFDTGARSDDFFYAWTELSYAPVRWLRFGGAIQHTRTYDTGLDIQRGPLIGMSLGRFDLTAYVFNPDKPDPPVVLGIAARF